MHAGESAGSVVQAQHPHTASPPASPHTEVVMQPRLLFASPPSPLSCTHHHDMDQQPCRHDLPSKVATHSPAVGGGMTTSNHQSKQSAAWTLSHMIASEDPERQDKSVQPTWTVTMRLGRLAAGLSWASAKGDTFSLLSPASKLKGTGLLASSWPGRCP